MLNIPYKAFRIGAESTYLDPIKYSKSRVSQSQKTTYSLHSKGAYMPGYKDKFTTNSKTKPKQNADLFNNKIMKAFIIEKFDSYKYKTNNRQPKDSKPNKFKEFAPYDDDTLLIAINSLYRHIFGNVHVMDFERPIDIERRLRNGDITVKEFTRQLCKSRFYQMTYFDKISQYKSIRLRYKHILGRPIINQKEIVDSSIILNKLGLKKHIDYLIDSEEYKINFGEDTVPHMRSWNSPNGLKTKSFLETSSITKAFATSDNCQIK